MKGLKVIGFDPGAKHTGYARILINGNEETLIENGVIEFENIDQFKKELELSIMDMQCVVIEINMAYSQKMQNPKIAAAVSNKLHQTNERINDICEIAGRLGLPIVKLKRPEICNMITGSNKSSKDVVRDFIRLRFGNLKRFKKNLHASDACSVAISGGRKYLFDLRLNKKQNPDQSNIDLEPKVLSISNIGSGMIKIDFEVPLVIPVADILGKEN